MRIRHITPYAPHLASYRYRVMIPATILRARGVDVTASESPADGEVNVFHKHGELVNPEEMKKVWSVMDVTDDHFQTPELGDIYRAGIAAADLVTCSSKYLRKRIKKETGVIAVEVIDPYEFQPSPFFWNSANMVLWFGHHTNLHTLDGVQIDCPIEIMSTTDRESENPAILYTRWSLKNMSQAFDRHDTVIIPRSDTEKDKAKGNNRIVNSLVRGKYVVASNIPSHEEFREYIYIADTLNFAEGLQWGRDHPEEVQRMVTDGQKYVLDHYAPDIAADQWIAVMEKFAEKSIQLEIAANA